MLHAPRQTGKASALTALRDLFNSRVIGDFRCVDVNVEVGQVACVDVQEGMRAILSSLAMSAEFWATTMWRMCGQRRPNRHVRFSWLRSANSGLYLLHNKVDDRCDFPLRSRREVVLKYS